MISRKYTSYQLCGKRVRFEQDMETRGGQGVLKGTIGTIIDASYGITVKTDFCPHCGQYCIIRKISRDDLTLLYEESIGKTAQN